MSRGDYEEARPLLQELVSQGEMELGESHSTTFYRRRSLADCLKVLRRNGEALPLWQRLVSDGARLLPREHKTMLVIRGRLADCLEILGRHEEALTVWQELVADSGMVFGKAHQAVLWDKQRLAECLMSLDRFQEALAIWQEVVAVRAQEKLSGKQDWTNDRNKLNLARCLRKLGRYREALAVRQELAAVSERVLGKEHPTAIWHRHRLLDAMVSCGHHDEVRKPPANGETVTGYVVAKVAVTKEPGENSRLVDSLVVLLPHGFKALLYYRELEGETLEDRAARLFFLREGERVTAQVVRIPLREKKPHILLSEQALKRSLAIDELRGKTLEGEITDVANAGVLVGLGRGLRGFLAIADMAGETWEQRFARRSSFKVGDNLTVRVTAVQQQSKRPQGKIDIFLSEAVTGKAEESTA